MAGYAISIALLASLATDPGTSSDRREFKTKVGSSSYRIVVEGARVTVLNKALLTGRTIDDRDKRRAAVRQATGCEITDEMWYDAKVVGTLACPSRPSRDMAEKE